jgi:imidazolonepropionase-like amidohydrolase
VAKRLAFVIIVLLGSPPAAAASTLVVIGGTLIDGTGGTPIANATVVISNGKILAAGASGTLRVPDGGERLDARGKWIVPGLIDMHVHY